MMDGLNYISKVNVLKQAPLGLLSRLRYFYRLALKF